MWKKQVPGSQTELSKFNFGTSVFVTVHLRVRPCLVCTSNEFIRWMPVPFSEHLCGGLSPVSEFSTVKNTVGVFIESLKLKIQIVYLIGRMSLSVSDSKTNSHLDNKTSINCSKSGHGVFVFIVVQ